MLYKIKAQCKEYILSPYFLLCVLAAALTCLFDVGIQINEESFLTVLECIIRIFSGEMTTDSAGLYTLPLLLQAGGESFSMLIPILAALPSVIPVCLQRQGGSLRFLLHRTGIGGYCLSALLAASITSGLVLALGTLFYGLFLLPFFPFLDPWGERTAINILISLGRKLVGMFLLGSSSVLPAYLLEFFTTNLYLVLCIPFLLRYLTAYTVSWLGVLFFNALHNPLDFLTPGAVQSAAYGNLDGLLALLTAVFVGVTCCLIGVWHMERRGDCGE